MLEDTTGSAHQRHARRYSGAYGEPDISVPDGYRVVSVDTPSCAELKDLVSLRWDLESAARFCEAYLAEDIDPDSPARPITEAFWIAAVVHYGRAFGSGVRLNASVDLGGLTPDEVAHHEYLIDLRNKHVAHSVNSFEQTQPIAYLTDSVFEKKAVTRIGQLHQNLSPLGVEEAEGLVALCSKFVLQLNRAIRKVNSEISLELAEMGVDAVYALPDFVVRMPQKGDVSMRRQKMSKSPKR